MFDFSEVNILFDMKTISFSINIVLLKIIKVAIIFTYKL